MRLTALTADNFIKVEGTEKRYFCNAVGEWEVGKKGSGLPLEFDPWESFDVSIPDALYKLGAIWPFRWIRRMAHNSDVLAAAWAHDRLLEAGYPGDFASSVFRRILRARGKSKFKATALFFLTLGATGFDRSH